MNILRRLREEAKKFDCSVCGTNHTRSDIRVLGKLDAAWIVRVTCSSCQTAFKLLVVVEEQPGGVSAGTTAPREARGARRRPPVTIDEVLDAHEALAAFEGDVSALFRRGLASARRDHRRA